MSLALAAVTVSVGTKRLLEDVSLAVEPGVFTVLVGPNGAGKSTALRTLAGDLSPESGAATLDGVPLGGFDLAALAERRVVLPQSSRPVFGFRVDEYVSLGRMPFGEPASSPALRERVAAAMRVADCDALAMRDVTTLSGGEFQRVQFARALAQLEGENGDPAGRYLLLDEPTSALDLSHQGSLLSSARRLAQRGVGVLAVLHDLNLAMQFADRIVVLAGGRVAADGPATSALTAGLVESVWRQAVDLVTAPGSERPAIICRY